ncbi:hypothetical protein PR048_033295 [Dryococelus australis]|uniref:DDE Tnp4 domain-containing protein n=1 Tax=Dryococelus australis TaxID=614101 RepID=A0ABQ9G0U6_9NEOP|nr:hypothetical protein PR048_033295 [Dryococelus australis]
MKVMKPYPGYSPASTSPNRISNYRLCRARRIVENVFGILAARLGVFLRPISLHRDKGKTVALTCIYLHNFLRQNTAAIDVYSPPGTFDVQDMDNGTVCPGSWKSDVQDANGLVQLQQLPRPATAAQYI